MWTAVAPSDIESPAPSARSKHSATLVGQCVYLLGGRNGNLPLKDFWRYNLVSGKWQQLKWSGDKLPCLQEHSAVVYRDSIYVFGGEVGFSAGSETPLWVYDIRNNSWRKIRTQKGTTTPKGRRGHTALVHRGTMLIYGGYQDLRGSCSELWAFHFETESWHLISSSKSNSDACPPARHKHSAILHDDAMWVYGGMTDLQERSDLWKWDIVASTWVNFKSKQNPGPLHSHAACRLPSSMIIFGGERDGHSTNDLWKFSFTTETWEKITINGIKPQPRAETVALTVSQLLLKDVSSSVTTVETGAARTRARTCNSADRNRPSSYLSNNKVSPCEKTYVFKPSQTNYIDGSDSPHLDNRNPNLKGSFLQEISKLSHINIRGINNKCSYTVLTGCSTDSTECLLRQYASPVGVENDVEEHELSTPTRGTMVKSKSAYVIKKNLKDTPSPEDKTNPQKPQRHVEFAANTKKITRDPISVPNFSVMTLPTPVLTPVEAARLVFLDSEDEADSDEVFTPPAINNIQVKANSPKDLTVYENFKVVKRGESYSSHLGYADNPLYQHILNANKFQNPPDVPEVSNENISSTSDYASIETVNRLSSASSYSVKVTPQEEEYLKNKEEPHGPFGFCNPNYLGPDIQSLIKDDNGGKKHFSKLLNTPDSVLEDSSTKKCEDSLELQSYNGTIDKNTKVVYKSSTKSAPPKSLPLDKTNLKPKCRASSASRVEKNHSRLDTSLLEPQVSPTWQDYVPLYVFIVGGKEQGQVTVFKRPLSIWKLKLF